MGYEAEAPVPLSQDWDRVDVLAIGSHVPESWRGQSGKNQNDRACACRNKYLSSILGIITRLVTGSLTRDNRLHRSASGKPQSAGVHSVVGEIPALNANLASECYHTKAIFSNERYSCSCGGTFRS
jgi:hypothetical protein